MLLLLLNQEWAHVLTGSCPWPLVSRCFTLTHIYVFFLSVGLVFTCALAELCLSMPSIGLLAQDNMRFHT